MKNGQRKTDSGLTEPRMTTQNPKHLIKYVWFLCLFLGLLCFVGFSLFFSFFWYEAVYVFSTLHVVLDILRREESGSGAAAAAVVPREPTNVSVIIIICYYYYYCSFSHFVSLFCV